MGRWFLPHPEDSGRLWPTRGWPATFWCKACEEDLLLIYEPESPVTCPGCRQTVTMPPLPRGIRALRGRGGSAPGQPLAPPAPVEPNAGSVRGTARMGGSLPQPTQRLGPRHHSASDQVELNLRLFAKIFNLATIWILDTGDRSLL